jgi:hypothetical protein
MRMAVATIQPYRQLYDVINLIILKFTTMKRSFLTEVSPDFENEFELELEDNTNSEFEDTNNEFELADQEFEDMQNEHEDYENIEGELDQEFENPEQEFEDTSNEYSYTNNESRNWLSENGSMDREYEDRIYSALSGEYENSFEMEQEIDRVLYEMEMDYFWGSAKKLWNKHKKKLLGLAKNFVPGGTLLNLAKLAGGDLRSILKSDLFKKGLSLAANAVAPGVGGAIAGSLLNNEMPSANNLRNQAKQAVQIARSAYQNMAGLVPMLNTGNIQGQLNNFSRQALNSALRRNSIYKGKKKRVIQIMRGSIVVVRPDKVVIYS